MSSLLSKGEAFKKYEFKKMCHVLGFKKSEIIFLLDNIEKNYKEWSKKKIDKVTGEARTYLDGTVKSRTFRDPSKLLKTVQKRIKENILSNIKLPNNVHGGVKKRSNITNAKAHQGNKYIFTTDLQEFYPNVNAEQIYRSLIAFKFSSHMAHWITRLVTYQNELPQGAPTSGRIADLVFFNADIKLIQLCKKNNIIYTRYVDDLTFSSQKDFSNLINEIKEIIAGNNFKMNHRKTLYNGSQTVTGIKVFLHKIDGTDKVVEKAKLENELNSPKKPYTVYLGNIRKTNKSQKKVASPHSSQKDK